MPLMQADLDSTGIKPSLCEYESSRETDKSAAADNGGSRDESGSCGLRVVVHDGEETEGAASSDAEVQVRAADRPPGVVLVEVQEQPRASRLYEALARDPEFGDRLGALWAQMPADAQVMAMRFWAVRVFAALPKDLGYKVFECAAGWLEEFLAERENKRQREEELAQVREAKKLMAAVRKRVAEMTKHERKG